MNKMTGRDYYIHNGYDELPEAVRIEMRRVFDTGVNNSGVWVRYKEVENLAGVMAYEYTHRPINTNADRIRAGSNEHIAGVVCTGCPPGLETGKQCTEDGACYDCWLTWLQSPADGGEITK